MNFYGNLQDKVMRIKIEDMNMDLIELNKILKSSGRSLLNSNIDFQVRYEGQTFTLNEE